MVQQSHTVADPWAVMIHSHHTLVADRAVVSARRLDILTAFTILILQEVRAHLIHSIPERMMHIRYINALIVVILRFKVDIVNSVGVVLGYHLCADK